jgi:hypothetical protein
MEEEGGELNLVLPFKIEDFIETSVAFAGSGWMDRFNHFANKYTIHFISDDAYDGHDDVFAYLIRVIYGSSILRSSLNHTDPTLITVLSETDLNQKTGGTRDALRSWIIPNRHVNINPDNYLTESSTQSKEPTPIKKISSHERPVLYMLDLHYDLTPGVSATFLDEKLDNIANSIQSTQPIILRRNSNSLFVGSPSVINLMDLFHQVESELNAHHVPYKSCFHAGPVYLPIDQTNESLNVEIGVLNELTHFGMNGSRYASQHVAAVLTLHPRKYPIEYVGSIKYQVTGKDLEVYLIGSQ